jgi:Lhr-like helicase
MHINNVTRQNFDKYIHSYKNIDWKQFRNTLDTLIKINPNITTSEIYTEINKFTTLIRARNNHSKRIKINPDKCTIPDEILEYLKN